MWLQGEDQGGDHDSGDTYSKKLKHVDLNLNSDLRVTTRVHAEGHGRFCVVAMQKTM